MSKDILIAIVILAVAGAAFSIVDMFRTMVFSKHKDYFYVNWIINCLILAGCVVAILYIFLFGGL